MSFTGKALYNPSGKAGEYAEWACNFYVGCSNGCEYCYCKKGILAVAMGQDVPQLKKCFRDEDHALAVFEKELQQNIAELRQHGLFLSFTTDPLLPECSNLTWRAVMFAMENDVPVKILTKMSGRWVDQLVEDMHQSWKGLIAIGFTLTGHDELEPGASTNAERIDAMRKLHDAGFRTFASIEPIVDFESSLKMIEDSRGACDLYKIGLMSGKRYDKKTVQNFIVKVLAANATVNENEYVTRKMLMPHTVAKAYDFHGRFYFKDGLLKQAGAERENLPTNCVDRDYNIFNIK